MNTDLKGHGFPDFIPRRIRIELPDPAVCFDGQLQEAGWLTTIASAAV